MTRKTLKPDLSSAELLEIYDHLREAHKQIQTIWVKFLERMEESDESAIDAVDNVLYLAEGYFSDQASK